MIIPMTPRWFKDDWLFEYCNPEAENLIQFALAGPAQTVGVGNANPLSTESHQQPQRRPWQGRSLLIVKSHKQGAR